MTADEIRKLPVGMKLDELVDAVICGPRSCRDPHCYSRYFSTLPHMLNWAKERGWWWHLMETPEGEWEASISGGAAVEFATAPTLPHAAALAVALAAAKEGVTT